MDTITIESLPSIIVATHREVISGYDAVAPLLRDVIGPCLEQMGCRTKPRGYCFTVEYSKKGQDSDIDLEYCEEVAVMGQDNDIIQFRTLPEIAQAVCVRHEGSYQTLDEAYAALFSFIEREGYRIIDYPRLTRIVGPWHTLDHRQWVSVIQAPVEPIYPS